MLSRCDLRSTPVWSTCDSLRESARDGQSSTTQTTVHPKAPLPRLSDMFMNNKVHGRLVDRWHRSAWNSATTNGGRSKIWSERGSGIWCDLRSYDQKNNFEEWRGTHLQNNREKLKFGYNLVLSFSSAFSVQKIVFHLETAGGETVTRPGEKTGS